MNDNLEASLADVGVSSRVLQAWSASSFEETFTPRTTQDWRWKSPELIRPSDEEERVIKRATPALDVWAFAMTVVEVRIVLTPPTPNLPGL